MSELDTATFVSKAWGCENVLVNNELYCLKKLSLLPGWQCSLHMHKIKDETFYIESGYLWMEFGDSWLPPRVSGEHSRFPMRTGDSIRIRPGTYHRFSNTGTEVCRILEVSTPHAEADVYRLEESRLL